jgi:sugar phosphate isomerase/epimerase
MKKFHASLEAAQHGKKDLAALIQFAQLSDCQGVQPSNFHMHKPDGTLLEAAVVRQHFDGLRLDGISAHCPFWVHSTAWTGSKTIRPFIPADVARKDEKGIQQWAEDYILRLLDLTAELNLHVMPMFWGVAFGWELATGYPWGFWKAAFDGDDADLSYDLLMEGMDRFVTMTKKVRDHARGLKIRLAHEIHPGTAAACADDFLMLRRICDEDSVVTVNADPSHCWEGETWEERFTKVGRYITACHVKDHKVRPGLPLRMMQPDWKKRAMKFTELGGGQIDLVSYTELLLDQGYADRYCELHGCETAPLIGEAEGAYEDGDDVSSKAGRFIASTLCRNFTEVSFEEGMGE